MTFLLVHSDAVSPDMLLPRRVHRGTKHRFANVVALPCVTVS
jgi:hypothetical protein